MAQPSATPSARLLNAAALLREMARGAESGPWESLIDTGETIVLRVSEDDDDPGAEVAVCRTILDGSYIAYMHPVVGLTLADWLAWMSEHCSSGNELSALRGQGLEQALAVCDALDGGFYQ